MELSDKVSVLIPPLFKFMNYAKSFLNKSNILWSTRFSALAVPCAQMLRKVTRVEKALRLSLSGFYRSLYPLAQKFKFGSIIAAI